MLTTRHTSAAVHYRASIIDAATGAEVRALPRKRNLILDAGLDLVASQKWKDCIRYAVAGTGTTATRRDSGAVTVSRTGSTLTASAGFFVADDVGKLFKFNSGAEVYISAYSSGTSVTTTTSGTIAASAGTIWAVNQTGLDTEVTRCNTYGTGGGDNSLALAGGNITQRRTFIFAAETGTVTYREIGWSPDGTSGANLFGRDVLSGAGLTLSAGQQLKVVLDLILTVELLAPESAPALVWGTGTAEQQLENIEWDTYFNPSTSSRTAFVSTSTDAFRSPRVLDGDYNPGDALAGTHYTVTTTAATYTPGTFTRTFSGFFGLNDGNDSALRSMGFGWLYFTTLYPVVRVKYSANQVKDSDHSLLLTFRDTWQRLLTN